MTTTPTFTHHSDPRPDSVRDRRLALCLTGSS